MFRIAIQTLGCKTNHYESASLAERFSEAGFTLVPADQEAELYLLNSCTVTHEAGRKCEQQLRRYRRNFPAAKIAVMGCHSQLKDLSELADFTRGVMGRLDIVNWAIELRAELRGTEPETLAEAKLATSSLGRSSRASEYESLGILSTAHGTRAEVKIQDGCEMFCAYCAICLARGKVRSRSRAEILAEVKSLTENGVQEIVLTGIHLCSFEKDLGRDSLALAELVEELAAVPKLQRIRLGSLEPKSMSDEVLTRLAAVDKLCPHFHLSLQSGCSSTLKRMRRQYTAEEYASRVSKIRELFTRPAITTDVMVAFPEESAAEHRESMDFILENLLSRLHIFRYSPRAHTSAAKLPQLAPEIAKERSREAQDLAEFLLHKFLVRNFAAELEVLLEEIDQASWVGYSENYIRCRLSPEFTEVFQKGQIIKVRPKEILGEELIVVPSEAAEN